MSLEKAIYHGKERRKQYPKKDSRNYDWSCRNHKSCPYCREGRQHFDKRYRRKAELDMEETEMRDYLTIGSVPCEEECVQVGAENYYEESRKECKRFIELLRKVFGFEPEGATLRVKAFPHDSGTYHEVVCYYDEAYPDSVDYAFELESNTPCTWEG